MRLFIAINVDEETKQNILAVQRRLRELGEGNFSRPENLHLTLVFLGEVAQERLAAIRKALDSTTFQPMKLIFDHVGCFKRDGGDIWWIGLAENTALLDMQQKLTYALLDEGFKLDSRRFSPHITLARKVKLAKLPDRNTLLGEPFFTQISAISLMCSERVGGRMTYTEQYRRKTID